MNKNLIIKTSDKILITGAAGYVGTKVVQTLLGYGFVNLRCFVRTASKSKNIETILKKEAYSPEDKIVTQLIPLTYANPTEIKRLFAPFISKSSVILAYPPTNMLIVTDVYSNIKRLLHTEPVKESGCVQVSGSG